MDKHSRMAILSMLNLNVRALTVDGLLAVIEHVDDRDARLVAKVEMNRRGLCGQCGQPYASRPPLYVSPVAPYIAFHVDC